MRINPLHIKSGLSRKNGEGRRDKKEKLELESRVSVSLEDPLGR